MVTLVIIPTFLPDFFAAQAIDSSLFPFVSMPIFPLSVLVPHAIAVPLAAESVIKESFERVQVIALLGNAFMANPSSPFRRKYSSVIILCGIDMPSPIKRKTYLTGFSSFCPAANAEHAIDMEAQSAKIFSRTIFMVFKTFTKIRREKKTSNNFGAFWFRLNLITRRLQAFLPYPFAASRLSRNARRLRAAFAH